ncbi:MAG: DMT family transporter [Caldilineaceae bacterium]|nr:DMT family transporter [Caldilineaceae bacterium]
MNHKVAISLLVLANVLWGSSYAVAKVALTELSPTLLGCYRIVLSVGLLWLIQLWTRGQSGSQPQAPMPRRDQIQLAGLGVLGVGLSYLFSYFGVNLTTATDAALMIIGEVIFTALLAAWWMQEPIQRWRWLGMALGAAGVVVLVLGHVTDSGSSDGWARVVGDLLILCALMTQAVYTVFGAELTRKYPPFTVLTYAYSGSLLIWIPLLLWHWATDTLTLSLSWGAIGGVLYLSLVTSLFCYFIWFSIASRLGAGVSALSLFVQPVVGTFIGIVLLNEAITPVRVLGAALIFLALYLTTMTLPKPNHVTDPIRQTANG